MRWLVGMLLDAVLALRESGATAVAVRFGPFAIDAAFKPAAEEEEGPAEHVGMGFCLDQETDDEDDE
jgi:hypothetical protein